MLSVGFSFTMYDMPPRAPSTPLAESLAFRTGSSGAPSGTTRLAAFVSALRAPNPVWLRLLFLTFLYVTVAGASFDGFYRKWGLRDRGQRFTFQEMIEGTAHRPFVHRQLLPKAANVVDRVLPNRLKEHLIENSQKRWWWEERSLVSRMYVDPEADRPYLVRYLFVYFASFGFLLAALFLLRRICLDIGLNEVAATFAPALMSLAMVYFSSMGGFFYDFPELFFLALAFWLALRGNFWALLPVAIPATYNKEAFLFFTASLLPLFQARYPLVKSLFMTGSLGLVSGVTYLLGAAEFRGNPGGSAESWFVSSLLFYVNPRNLLAFEANFGVFTPRCYSLVGLGLIAIVLIRAWPNLSTPLKRHGQLIAAINIPLVVVFCGPGEMRNFSLSYLFFFVSLAQMMSDWAAKAVPPPAPAPG